MNARTVLVALLALVIVGGIVAVALAGGGSDRTPAARQHDKGAHSRPATSTSISTTTTTATSTQPAAAPAPSPPPPEDKAKEPKPPKGPKPPAEPGGEKIPPGQAKKGEG